MTVENSIFFFITYVIHTKVKRLMMSSTGKDLERHEP